jgi:hypothetical protein
MRHLELLVIFWPASNRMQQALSTHHCHCQRSLDHVDDTPTFVTYSGFPATTGNPENELISK